MINTKQSLSICLIGPYWPATGGQERYINQLYNRLIRSGHKVMIIGQDLTGKARKSDKIIPIKARNPIDFSIKLRKYFLNKVTLPIDIVHGNDIYHSSIAILKPNNVNKIVTTTHNSYLQRMQHYPLKRKLPYPATMLIENLTLLKSSAVITVSQYADQYVKRYLGINQTKLIPNGVNLELFCPVENKPMLIRDKFGIKKDEKVILFQGRLDQNKHPDRLIDAMSHITDTNIHLVLLGSGKEKDNLIELTNKMHLHERVHFIDLLPQNQMPLIFQDVDLFMLPSDSEGLPMTLLEAAATALPLVATKSATGESDILQNGVNGFFMEPNKPNETAKLIRKSLDNKQQLGKHSLEIAKNKYSLDQMIDQTEKMYSLLLNDNQK